MEEGGIKRSGTQCDSIALWTTYLLPLWFGVARFPFSCEAGRPFPFRGPLEGKYYKTRYPDAEEWLLDGVFVDSRTVEGLPEGVMEGWSGNHLLMHELGHSMGLFHTFQVGS